MAATSRPSVSPARERPFAIYDCFAAERFGGNVGGMVFDAADLSPAQMQSIAREINAPVTGFITAADADARDVSVRFFMPAAEIAMCGHVTIGLFAHFAAGGAPGVREAVMRPPAGPVAVTVETPENGGAPTVMMGLKLPVPAPATPDLGALAAALGAPDAALAAVAAPGGWDTGLRHLFVAFEDPGDVRALEPNFAALADVTRALDMHTVACFAFEPECAASGAQQIVIRDFCPAFGVNEAPASGTTNGALAGYLVNTGLTGPGERRFEASQGAAIGRPSRILSEISCEGGAITRLAVGGQALPSLHGQVAPV